MKLNLWMDSQNPWEVCSMLIYGEDTSPLVPSTRQLQRSKHWKCSVRQCPTNHSHQQLDERKLCFYFRGNKISTYDEVKKLSVLSNLRALVMGGSKNFSTELTNCSKYLIHATVFIFLASLQSSFWGRRESEPNSRGGWLQTGGANQLGQLGEAGQNKLHSWRARRSQGHFGAALGGTC